MKYIDLDTATNYPFRARNKFHREYIERFIHLLELVAPGKYKLDTINLLASIENTESQLTALQFSSNPF